MADGTDNAAAANGTPASAAPAAAPAPAASPAPASTVVEPKADAGQPSISDIMGFDPFAPGKDGKMTVTEKPGDVKPEPKPGEPAPTPAPAPKPGETPVEAPKPGEAKPTLDLKPLESLIRDQTAAIQKSLEKPEPAGDAKPQAPRFALGVPDQLVQALASDDPKERGVALNAVVSGVANHVWQATQELVQQEVAKVVQSLPNVMAAHTTYSREQEKVATDFFGKYEMFKNEAFTPILQHAAMQVAQAWQAEGKPIAWNDEFRDAVAENMFTRFPMLKTAAAAAPAAEVKRQPFATGGGARQPAETQQSEFEAVLNSV